MNDQYASGEGGAQPIPVDDEQAGYTICIKVDGQGAITVGVDADQAEVDPDMMEGDGGNYAPAESIENALETARGIYENNGQAPENISPDDSVMRGYMKGGKGKVGGMPVNKVFGDE